jgi:hypothetical protein
MVKVIFVKPRLNSQNIKQTKNTVKLVLRSHHWDKERVVF